MPGTREKLRGYISIALVSLVLLGLAVGTVAGAVVMVRKVRAATAHRKILQGETCASCHTSPHRPPLTGACENCHVTTTWKSSSYRHAVDAFNTGKHKSTPCVRCHKLQQTVPDSKCISCHTTAAHRLSENCALCHSTSNWTPLHRFPKGHVRLTRTHAKTSCPDCHTVHNVQRTWYCANCHKEKHDKLPLVRGHANVKCVDCHSVKKGQDNLNVVSVRAKQCSVCHVIRHLTLTDCAKCHTDATFKKSTFKHDTVWALTGAHVKLDCLKCHPYQQWAESNGTECVSCHEVRHARLFDCARCHNTVAFRPSTFRHFTVYPLTGSHARLACSSCHFRQQWADVANATCASCHGGAQHGGLVDCQRCHTTVAFKPSTFVHNRVFQLSGAHRRLACSRCHPRNQYARAKGTACISCHTPRHGDNTPCDRCHLTTAWAPIKPIQHSSSYPLIGKHQSVACRACHKDLIFRGTPRRCESCHADKSHGIPNCETCHTPVSWSIILPH